MILKCCLTRLDRQIAKQNPARPRGKLGRVGGPCIRQVRPKSASLSPDLSRPSIKLHATDLSKTTRTIPANDEAHTSEMVQVEPRRPFHPRRNPGPADGCEGAGNK